MFWPNHLNEVCFLAGYCQDTFAFGTAGFAFAFPCEIVLLIVILA